MKTLFAALHHALSRGEGAILVTVIASSGSTPRGAGARMLITGSGRIAGTVGGGIAEHHCIIQAQELLSQSQTRQSRVLLDLSKDGSLGAVCGGWMDIHFFPVAPNDPSMRTLCADIAARFSAGAPFWLATPLQDDTPLALWPQPQDASAYPLPASLTDALSNAKGRFLSTDCWFCEELQGAGVVYIFGGGHVAQALVPVLAPLDFPCIVLENREEFSDPALFPLAREVRKIDFSQVLQSVSVSEEDYICIMTRGHQDDLLIEQQVLHTPAQYIGLIGSAKKVAATSATLESMGFSKEEISRIITPIGLAIGGKTPAEIAVSIAAQLIRHRASRQE